MFIIRPQRQHATPRTTEWLSTTRRRRVVQINSYSVLLSFTITSLFVLCILLLLHDKYPTSTVRAVTAFEIHGGGGGRTIKKHYSYYHHHHLQRPQPLSFTKSTTTTTTSIQESTTLIPTHLHLVSSIPKQSEEEEKDGRNAFDNDDVGTTSTTNRKKKIGTMNRSWDNLNPNIKARRIQEGQARAIANKKKRESDSDKKRRQLMFVREKQLEKKRAARIVRPLAFDDRTPLSALVPGLQTTGIVISLTKFGAYVDIGTQVDGLLHISQMSVDEFVTHPRQMVSPGDKINVTVRSRDPERQKLHLTMLPPELVAEQLRDKALQKGSYSNNNMEGVDDDNDENQSNRMRDDRILLEDLQIDDELWGELKRVTQYGAYVNVGATVDAFLHFMDHPEFEMGKYPSDFMCKGDRVRVWVSDVDPKLQRIKLTAFRPQHLPGPRRELNL